MSALFPHANTLAAIMVFLVGFGFHFCGQLLSVANWKYACKVGLQDKDASSDYYPYEHGTAVGDVLIGWTYPIAAIGLIMGASWAYKLAFIPGVVLLYHGLCAWFWETDRRAMGHGLWTDTFRGVWCGANFATGLLTILVAWAGPV